MKSLNRTYTISKENSVSIQGTLERQKWDKQCNALNSPNFISNEKKYYTNENNNETPAWVEYSSEKP